MTIGKMAHVGEPQLSPEVITARDAVLLEIKQSLAKVHNHWDDLSSQAKSGNMPLVSVAPLASGETPQVLVNYVVGSIPIGIGAKVPVPTEDSRYEVIRAALESVLSSLPGVVQLDGGNVHSVQDIQWTNPNREVILRIPTIGTIRVYGDPEASTITRFEILANKQDGRNGVAAFGIAALSELSPEE
jgi:hypothetical protein